MTTGPKHKSKYEIGTVINKQTENIRHTALI